MDLGLIKWQLWSDYLLQPADIQMNRFQGPKLYSDPEIKFVHLFCRYTETEKGKHGTKS